MNKVNVKIRFICEIHFQLDMMLGSEICTTCDLVEAKQWHVTAYELQISYLYHMLVFLCFMLW
jgi:hypothetical protein